MSTDKVSILHLSSFPRYQCVIKFLFRQLMSKQKAKNYRPFSLLSGISKVFKKVVNNRLEDHLKKYGVSYDCQYGYRTCRSFAHFLTVVSDRLLGLLIGLGLLELHRFVFKLSSGPGMLVFFINSILMEFQAGYLALLRVFSVIRRFPVVPDGKAK